MQVKKNVLLLNRYPYWLYDHKGFFMEDVDNLIILHSNETNFDFPKEKFRTAMICDFGNKEELNDCIEFLYKYCNFDQVVSVTERFVLLAAQIRDKYSLNGMDYQTALKFRDKLLMKVEVRKAGIRTPYFLKAKDIDNVRDFYEKYGSCVVKPLDGMGSVSTYFVKSLDDISQLNKINSKLTNYIVEEHIEGDMYHCDSIVEQGDIKMCSISQYSRPPANFSNGQNLSSVMIENSPLREEIERLNQKVLKTLNIINGVTHLEFFVTSEKEIIFCEVGSRAGGSGIIPSIQEVYGINLFKADIHTQLQSSVRINKSDQYAGWLIIVGKPGIIDEISNENEFTYSWITYKNVMHSKGDTLEEVKSSTGAVAEFTIVGRSEWDVKQKIRFIEKNFKLEVINYEL